ncbi:MAG: hypothetical protein OXE85_13225 [Roseovarius sp.]|nr:hypothetical protein [Roseovarius sp.]
MSSLDGCLRRIWTCFRAARSGGIQDLGRRGLLFITRPAIMHHVAKRSDLEWAANDLFRAMGDGILDAAINYECPLKDAVKAHQAMESGKTPGATALVP